jgi:hypothetical protein
MKEEKKVIFIGGTSYSGSTFFDMMIGNDKSGFSCGEVNALFYPFRQHHLNPTCGCASEDCSIWNEVLKSGRKQLYTSLFNLMPHVKFIVDSSKDPFWIESQAKNLKNLNIGVKSLLIWKNPHELAYSFNKRGRSKWDKIWLNYHRVYSTLVPNWRSVSYSELTTKPETLENVCQYLEIPYFEKKNEYWKKKHHLLFGNTSATVHLYSEKEPKYSNKSNKSDKSNGDSKKNTYRSIYYERVENKLLIEEVDKVIQKEPGFRDLLRLLEDRSINAKNGNDYENTNIKLSSSELLLRRLFSIIKKSKMEKIGMLKRKLLFG